MKRRLSEGWCVEGEERTKERESKEPKMGVEGSARTFICMKKKPRCS